MQTNNKIKIDNFRTDRQIKTCKMNKTFVKVGKEI